MSSERIRFMTPDDVTFALELIGAEGWVGSRALWECLLAHDPAGCFVAEVDGERVGMVSTTRYDRTGWVGHLIVRPGFRRSGLGTRLFAHAMDVLRGQGVRTMHLEADPPGVRIYLRAGFRPEFESLRFRVTPCTGLPAGDTEPLTQADLPALFAFDAERFGDDRSRLLAMIFERASVARVLRRRGEIAGYVLGVPAMASPSIGPLVAVDVDAARHLLGAALAELPTTFTITLGIPETNREGVALYRSLGFEPRPSCTRMACGTDAAPGRVDDIFGIANGAIG